VPSAVWCSKRACAETLLQNALYNMTIQLTVEGEFSKRENSFFGIVFPYQICWVLSGVASEIAGTGRGTRRMSCAAERLRLRCVPSPPPIAGIALVLYSHLCTNIRIHIFVYLLYTYLYIYLYIYHHLYNCIHIDVDE